MKYVYNIIEKEGLEKNIWQKVGVAFDNHDGSLNVILDCLPLNGRLHIRERRPRPEGDGAEPPR